MKYAVIILSLISVGLFFMWGAALEDLDKAVFQRDACQVLATDIDGLLKQVDSDYQIFIDSIVDYMDNNISQARFNSNLEPLAQNRERLEFKYDNILVKNNDKCFGIK